VGYREGFDGCDTRARDGSYRGHQFAGVTKAEEGEKNRIDAAAKRRSPRFRATRSDPPTGRSTR
jgi:hypothetical protein